MKLEYIDLKNMVVVLEGGTVVPIVELVDWDDEETDDISEAAGGVAGTPEWGYFDFIIEPADTVH